MDIKEGPWERVSQAGRESANIADLLSICLARDSQDAEAAHRAAVALLRIYKPERITSLSRADLHEHGGLEAYEADRILAALELGRRSVQAGKGEVTMIGGHEDAYRLMRPYLEKAKEERFVAAFLTIKSGVIAVREIHRGATDMSIVDPKVLFREALRESAARLIVAHNHPSGDPEPSPEDISITRKLREAGEILDIELLDHIIVGHAPDGAERYVSLRSRRNF